MFWLCDALCQRIIQSDAFLTVWSLLLLLCCHHFLFLCSLSLSLPAAIVFCHSFRFTIGSSSLSHSLFAFLCLSECKEGIRQWPQYSRCTPAVPAGTAEMAVLMLWPAAPGYTWREEITGGWSAQAKESADLDPVCAFGLCDPECLIYADVLGARSCCWSMWGFLGCTESGLKKRTYSGSGSSLGANAHTDSEDLVWWVSVFPVT